jgi:hypothetical protein
MVKRKLVAMTTFRIYPSIIDPASQKHKRKPHTKLHFDGKVVGSSATTSR